MSPGVDKPIDAAVSRQSSLANYLGLFFVLVSPLMLPMMLIDFLLEPDPAPYTGFDKWDAKESDRRRKAWWKRKLRLD